MSPIFDILRRLFFSFKPPQKTGWGRRRRKRVAGVIPTPALDSNQLLSSEML
jgi:hypothetical protein